MSDNPVLDPADPAYNIACDPDPANASFDSDPSTLCVNGGEGNVVVQINDVNGQTLPTGTTISFSATNGEIKSRSSFTISNTTFPPLSIVVRISATDNTDPGDDIGELQLTITTPKGNETYSDAIRIRD
ncbi:MAG: hypothetical protein KZQ65_08240 [Candidatus Thiodiazotropha sp. (ex Gloverina cf. vestifex)]|nr:hypothetical protein [Candidatus Thiodiazotropha sp. (ex Gloverina cf. vestifex)]